MFKILSPLLCAVLANQVACLPRRLTFDELLSDKDLSSAIEDYQVEEDDVGLQDIVQSFNLGSGRKNNTISSTKAGNATRSGFRKNNSFKKGLKGSHDIRDEQGFYKLGGAHSLGTIDDADFYVQKDAIENGNQGVDIQEQKNYRHGSKTRGYHRIHHKDEFKKDRLFYDDNDSRGSLRRYGDRGVAYRAGVGGKVRKGIFHHDLEKGVYGKQGYFDKGSLDKQLEGFANSQGFDGAFNANQASSIADSESDFD